MDRLNISQLCAIAAKAANCLRAVLARVLHSQQQVEGSDPSSRCGICVQFEASQYKAGIDI